MNNDFVRGAFVCFIWCGILNLMPFSDSEQYRRAIDACEKKLPREQKCMVVGVKM